MQPPLRSFKRLSSFNVVSTLRTPFAHGIVIITLALMAFGKGEVTITTPSLPNAVEGTPYSGTVTASGGCTPYEWSIVSGSLPHGLSGQPSSSTTSYTISGTPTGTGSDTFEVSVKGCGGHVSKQTYTVQVQQPDYAVDLNWDVSNSPDITGYNVYRSIISGGPYSKINASLVASTTYTDTTVAENTTYYYVATAVNSSNQESGYSNQTTAAIP